MSIVGANTSICGADGYRMSTVAMQPLELFSLGHHDRLAVGVDADLLGRERLAVRQDAELGVGVAADLHQVGHDLLVERLAALGQVVVVRGGGLEQVAGLGPVLAPVRPEPCAEILDRILVVVSQDHVPLDRRVRHAAEVETDGQDGRAALDARGFGLQVRRQRLCPPRMRRGRRAAGRIRSWPAPCRRRRRSSPSRCAGRRRWSPEPAGRRCRRAGPSGRPPPRAARSPPWSKLLTANSLPASNSTATSCALPSAETADHET